MSGNIPGSSRALEIQAPCIVFLVVTPSIVFLRIWSRVKSNAGLGWDDWTSLASAVFTALVMGLMLGSCSYGFGQHLYNLSASNKLMTLKLFFVAQVFYKLTINLTKMSILLLYLRIFLQRWLRITCHVLLCIIAAYMVAAFFAAVFQCIPISRAWNKSVAGTCIDITKNWYANAGFSITTDLIILVLPMYPIYSSHLALKHKIAVMALFALGAFVAVTSILRMQTLDLSSPSPDTTFDIDSSMWTMIEENISVICSCLPMMRPALSLLFPTYFSSYGTSSTTSNDLSLGGKHTQRPAANRTAGGLGTPGDDPSSSPGDITDNGGRGGRHSPIRSLWTQFHGCPKERAGISLNEITASPMKRMSEDSMGQILRQDADVVDDAETGGGGASEDGGASRGESEDGHRESGIRKVLQYHDLYS